MIVMVRDRPQFVCDVCHFEMPPDRGEALYRRPTRAHHFPEPRLACGDACAIVVEREFSAWETVHVPWPTFLHALGEPYADHQTAAQRG
jgi:hypothetical protein